MHHKQTFCDLPFRTISRAAIIALSIATVFILAALSASAQDAVPSTAREAAASPAFASRLARQARAQKSDKARGIIRSHRGSPQFDVLYDNGPYNGTTDAWTINFGFSVSDSFTLATDSSIGVLHFVYWNASTSDLLTTVDMQFGSTSFAGTPQTLTGVTNTFLGTNQFGYALYEADYSFYGVPWSGAGYITLSNACSTSGCSVSNPIYWDENSGPSLAYESGLGSIPSETFTLGGGYCGSSLRVPPRPMQPQTYRVNAVAAPSAQAQNYKVLHNFSLLGADGGVPMAGLTMDHAGNLYGTAAFGAYQRGYGVVFMLAKQVSGWIFTPLYSFTGGTDGDSPQSRVLIGPNGTLYGTTLAAGGGDCQYQGEPPGCGTVFSLRPPAHPSPTFRGGWTETTLHAFGGRGQGAFPLSGLVFDQTGNLYGTTSANDKCDLNGLVYELTPSQNGWTYDILHSFTGGNDGSYPVAGVIFDNSGNLYGTTAYGGTAGYGTAFRLVPLDGGWTENILYSNFDYYGSSGGVPTAGLIFDQSGNLYGATSLGLQGATVFSLSPSGADWTFNVLYNFGYIEGPAASLVIDGAGNLYGTTTTGGAFQEGNVFRLIPGPGGWTYSSLHDFSGSDGALPYSNVIFDANGNLYGTTSSGGAYGWGVVWEITP